ncbi:hypothetical protein XYCOK13_23990 [Xylanibacillus composti]|uniref:Nitroreductase domain-containing protein n=1 Tax=Xylanibacillus composti TaxID=1572762 RepID=A0A8J4M2Z5_9BACL|nr:SagB family peptide dehydrogenase [Xylanibacillus composti]GIQ69575.1 hypothetical protein XYCOK13_23990 [Xylanibacillus composti]
MNRINAVIRDDNPLSLFQYVRARGYAGNRMDIPRPERFKHFHGSSVRLKTSLFHEEESKPFSLDGVHVLEQILLPSYGVTSVKFHGHQSELLWSFPSAGACYPIEIYVAIRSLTGVPPGIYYYAALQASLYKLRDFNEEDRFEELLLPEDRQADFYFIVTTVPWRSCWKYSYKGYRFSFIDAGHVTANFQLVLQCLGLRTNVYTGTVSNKLRELLQLSPYEDAASVIAVHHTAESDQSTEPVLEQASTVERDVWEESHAAVAREAGERPFARSEAAQDTGIETFDWHPIFLFRNQVDRFRQEPDRAWLARHKLPPEWLEYAQALQLIIRRRSSSSYQQRAISKQSFQHMLQFMQETEMTGITLYMFIHAVEGIPPGIYRWDGELACVRRGECRELSASLSLGQMFVRDCSVLFMYAVDIPTSRQDSYALYQQRLIDAGILGQLVYLKSQEMGLGYSAIGGYYDEEVKEVLQLPPEQQVIYAGTWGVDAKDDAIKHDRYRLNEGGN